LGIGNREGQGLRSWKSEVFFNYTSYDDEKIMTIWFMWTPSIYTFSLWRG